MRLIATFVRRIVVAAIGAALIALALGSAARAADADDVLAAMQRWSATYGSAGASGVEMLPLYAADATFWGTGGKQPFVGREAFQPYFATQFTNFHDRSVTFNDPLIRVYGGAFATATGTYTFNVTTAANQLVNVTHRFTFALVKQDGGWLIAQHHSSAMPQ